MTGAYPKAVPEALVICAAITPHRHVEADQAVESVAVNPVDIAVALRATQEREGRVMDQPPAHAQRNRHHRTQDQRKSDSIGKGDPCQKSRNRPAQVPNAVLRSCDKLPKPRAERSPNIQPPEDQKNAQGDNHQPDDLELVSSYKLAQPTLTMAAMRLRRAPGFVPMQLYSPFVPIHRRANSRARSIPTPKRTTGRA